MEPGNGLLNTLSNQSILQEHSSVNMTLLNHLRRLDLRLSYPFNLSSSKAMTPNTSLNANDGSTLLPNPPRRFRDSRVTSITKNVVDDLLESTRAR
jgi:hypothetical protein